MNSLANRKTRFSIDNLYDFNKIKESIKYILIIFKDLSDRLENHSTSVYKIEEETFAGKLLIDLTDDLKKKLELFYSQMEIAVDRYSKHQESLNSFDSRIQQSMNGPLTDEFANLILHLKRKLKVSYQTLGEMIEAMSGSFLYELVRHKEKRGRTKTLKANLLKIEISALAEIAGISLEDRLFDDFLFQ